MVQGDARHGRCCKDGSRKGRLGIRSPGPSVGRPVAENGADELCAGGMPGLDHGAHDLLSRFAVVRETPYGPEGWNNGSPLIALALGRMDPGTRASTNPTIRSPARTDDQRDRRRLRRAASHVLDPGRLPPLQRHVTGIGIPEVTSAGKRPVPAWPLCAGPATVAPSWSGRWKGVFARYPSRRAFTLEVLRKEHGPNQS
jgi:hypothetical protein